MIRVAHKGAVSTITLARPERRNALTPEMLDGIVRAVAEVPGSSNALVVTGEGKAFCAGFDLTLCRDDQTGEVMRLLLTGLARAVRALREAPMPVVIAAHGAAIAGGCALLGGADFTFTNHEASLGYPVTRLGISPAVSAPYLRLSVGDGVCRERMLDSGLMTGREAEARGLVFRSLAGPEEVLPGAVAMAAALAGKPPGAVRATRAWLNELTEPGAGAEAGLRASLSLTGGTEERAMLERIWKPL